MCRMFAYFSNTASTISDLVVHHPRSLLQQSRCDLFGETHADGWGVGYYDAGGHPQVFRSIHAAHEDAELLRMAEEVRTRVALAHVRQASVGSVSPANTHPFTYGPWLFAHNGTVRGFDQVRRQLERETEPELLSRRVGSTDSEAVFYWLLSCFKREGIVLDPTDPEDRHDRADVLGIVELLGESIHRLAGWSMSAEPDELCKLNFLLTDGQLLVASRYQHSLHWLTRGNADIVPADQPQSYRAVIVASEPISDEPWQEVPDRSILAVGTNFHSFLHPF